MERARSFRFACAAALLVGSVGVSCGGLPAAGEALGTDYTKRERGKGECKDAGGQSRPLVVDWESADRAELEARASRSLVVVKYESCRMEVLKRCSVRGGPKYDYIGLTPKKDTVTMRDASEVYANIPVYAAKFEGRLAQSGSLDVAMTIVGQWDTAQPVARVDELEGECAGATHLVTALTVGAFEFSASNEVQGAVGGEIAGAGAGAKQSRAREVLNRDGEDASCGAASGEDKKPPFGCGALLRLEVVPVGQARQAEPTCPGGTQWDGAQCVAVKQALQCAEGMIPDKERGCVPKKADAVAVRKATAPAGALVAPVAAACGSLAACQEGCDRGEAKGCLGLGGLLRGGAKPGQASDEGARAAAAFQKACDGGEPTACTALGEMKYQGLGVPKDAAAALPLLEKACEGGDLAGCNDVGLALSQGSPSDPARAAKYFDRACNAASSLGCLGLGLLVRDGRGMAKDPARAKQLFQKACDAKIGPACKLL